MFIPTVLLNLILIMNKNKKKSGKKMCCIVNCSNTYLTGHKLFNFPNRPHEKELKEKWVQCIKRMKLVLFLS